MTTFALHTSRTKIVLLWTLQIATAAMFFLAGVSKLAGAAPMVQLFGAIGLGQWFRYLTGAIEVVSAVLEAVPVSRELAEPMLPVSLLLHPTSATRTAAVNKHFFIRVIPLLLKGEEKGLHQVSPFETPQTRIAPSIST